VAATRDDDAAQVGDSGDDMAITAFPALAPRLRSVAYPDNFKPNIQKYGGRSDANILLSTYYVTVKAAGGSFDHMAAYFPLVTVAHRCSGSTTSRQAASRRGPTYLRLSH
jgi:hypothetical protein